MTFFGEETPIFVSWSIFFPLLSPPGKHWRWKRHPGENMHTPKCHTNDVLENHRGVHGSWWNDGPKKSRVVPQTVCLTLGVLTVVVKGRVARSRWRTEFVAIFVLSCLHVRFVCEFTYFRLGAARRRRVLYVNFRSFRLFNFFDVHFSW